MNAVRWKATTPTGCQLQEWCELGAEPGVIHVVFEGFSDEHRLGWDLIGPWTRTRAVTVAELRSDPGGAALDAALCADLVYLRREVELDCGSGEPSVGLVWALGRAGRAALARGLLDPVPIGAREAVRLGLAQAVLEDGDPVPVAGSMSLVALTAARDLLRAAPAARPELELTAFRLLFAAGDPGKGARAFLERREPDFG